MKITEFVKKELTGWKRHEIIGLGIVVILILFNSITLKDNIIAAISAFCGIMYTTIAGKGKVSCYLFGVCGSVCYSILSFQNALYGNLILYMCYYIPSQIYGFFSWQRNLNSNTCEIIKTRLSSKQRIILVLVSIIGSIITTLILKHFHDSNPLIDGITTFLSILGMYLTVKRVIEQWLIWMVVNGLSLIMWINVVMHGTKAYSTLIMWGVYLILAFYFWFEWNKSPEFKNTNITTKTPC